MGNSIVIMHLKGQGSNFVLILLGVVAVASAIFLYLNQVQTPKEMELRPSNQLVSYEPGPFPATNDPMLNEILGSTRNNFEFDINQKWAEFRCPISKEQSLVNLVHIKKNGDNYEIECWFGPSYNLLNYTPRSDSMAAVYGGWVKEKRCDQEVARVIDKAVREVYKCNFPIYTPLTAEVNDYYAFFVVCGPLLYDTNARQKACFANIPQGLYAGYRGVIIPETGKFTI